MPGMTGFELLKKIKVCKSPLVKTQYHLFIDQGFHPDLPDFLIELILSIILQNSSTLREIPVVIMSSENILTRIDRYDYAPIY